ncbi:hypothetical protein C2E23DRAFT_511069 [Lenzites betulinus]|nr:hypothetical protein C2E23DRAFT_511069 [Lenzites betulinus]
MRRIDDDVDTMDVTVAFCLHIPRSRLAPRASPTDKRPRSRISGRMPYCQRHACQCPSACLRSPACSAPRWPLGLSINTCEKLSEASANSAPQTSSTTSTLHSPLSSPSSPHSSSSCYGRLLHHRFPRPRRRPRRGHPRRRRQHRHERHPRELHHCMSTHATDRPTHLRGRRTTAPRPPELHTRAQRLLHGITTASSFSSHNIIRFGFGFA